MTKEQEEYRKSILKGRHKPKKVFIEKKIESPPHSHWTPWQKTCYYLKNCHWWVVELIGNVGYPVDKKRMLETISAIEQHCRDMRKLLNSEQNVQVSDTTKDDSSNADGTQKPITRTT